MATGDIGNRRQPPRWNVISVVMPALGFLVALLSWSRGLLETLGVGSHPMDQGAAALAVWCGFGLPGIVAAVISLVRSELPARDHCRSPSAQQPPGAWVCCAGWFCRRIPKWSFAIRCVGLRWASGNRYFLAAERSRTFRVVVRERTAADDRAAILVCLSLSRRSRHTCSSIG